MTMHLQFCIQTSDSLVWQLFIFMNTTNGSEEA